MSQINVFMCGLRYDFCIEVLLLYYRDVQKVFGH
jgi:hypothetical protein